MADGLGRGLEGWGRRAGAEDCPSRTKVGVWRTSHDESVYNQTEDDSNPDPLPG